MIRFWGTTLGGWHEGLRRAEHPQRGGGRTRRLRQDVARLRDALRHGRGEPAGPGGRRLHGHRLRPRRDRAQDQPADARLAYGEWKKNKINLLDAPGYANFLSEARAALRVADAALVVVDAVSGVEVQTEKVWGYAEEYGLPRLVVVNRMDRERASFLRALESLQRAFGRGGGAAGHPPRRGEGLRGHRGAGGGEGRRLRDDQSGKFKSVDVPAEVQEAARSWREKLVEMVAESNEDLMEAFFEKGTLSPDDLARGLRQAVMPGRSSPCCPPRRCATWGCTRCWTPWWTSCPRPWTAGEVAGTDPVDEGGGHAQARRGRAPLRLRLQDHRRPARRPHHASSASTPAP